MFVLWSGRCTNVEGSGERRQGSKCERSEEALALNPDVIATGCPFV